MSTATETKTDRYSQELSAYTFRQLCMANALLDRTKAEAMPQLSAAYRRISQADKITSDGRTLP
ncbi:hypothetical protein BYT27DRAFT_7083965 [Phlegmacium glaucopus]|nr:hypothetical protein BYT27DRAFT_7083965 [Phlegmacium glaucopus]